MNHEIIITPEQWLKIESVACSTLNGGNKVAPKAQVWFDCLISDFAENMGKGLFCLAKSRVKHSLPDSMLFWQQLANRYMTELCRVPETEEVLKPILLDAGIKADLNHLFLTAPPMKGGEYLTVEMLAALWMTLDSWVLEQREEASSTLASWLLDHAPQWHQVGRVCFHLAENKSDREYPFAFMATYAPRLSKAGKVQYQPLGKALQEYAGARNNSTLLKLLSPVHEAAEKLEFVAELVETGDVFHPLAWAPHEAHEFLQHVATLEDSGLFVRLPNWWKRRPKAQVSVTIGDKKRSLFGADGILDFQVNVALGGKRLSKKELEALMAAEDGLVLFKNQWIEVDHQKLEEALAHWKEVEAEAGDGVSFIQGMRLLAGASNQLASENGGITEQQWTQIDTGKWLSDIVSHLRDPENIASIKHSKHFKGTLRPYQEIGKNWLYFLCNLGLGACLADDMGLGKTIQIISLLVTLKDEKRLSGEPSILVLPTSLLANWDSEIEKFAPSLRVKTIHGSALDKKQMAEHEKQGSAAFTETDVVLTTYGTLLRQKWLLDVSWKLAILDEAQAIKNPASRQTKAAKSLQAKSRIALTGTPVENSLADLWSLFDFLTPGLLGTVSQFKAFTKKLSEQPDTRYAPLKKLINPYILRRLKTDKSIISDLPDKTEVKAYCGLSSKQAAVYMNSVEQLKDALDTAEGIQRRGIVLSYLMRFKQVCNHPSQLSGDGDYGMEDSGKFNRLREICTEIAARQEKVLVFTQFREMTEPLAMILEEIFGSAGLILHGGSSVKQRKQMVESFQSKQGPSFFVLSLKAGGTGLTLTAASHVIHFDRWWNPAVENQATDRAYRIGQHKNVMVHKFICKGTIEEKINIMLEEKADLADNLLEGAAQSVLTEMTNDELISTVALNLEENEL